MKHLLGVVAFTTGAYRRFFRDRAVIAVFHRVDDRYPDDALTCTTDRFAKYCDFFRRYFTVVSVGRLLEMLERREDISGHLAITFDDGYKDNAGAAAPILAAARLPACFFIATEFIESTRTPWWDAKAGIPTEWMTWSDVRGLATQGFEIGSHTRHHVDLGAVSGKQAVDEITECGKRLLAETGVCPTLFSYPYGARHQISEVNRRAVEEAGYRCCLSAHGGTIAPGADAFRLPRVPVSDWFLTPYQFGFETMMEGEGSGAGTALARDAAPPEEPAASRR